MKETTNKTKNQAKEFILGATQLNTKANLKMINLTEKELWIGPTVANTSDSGVKVLCKE